MSFKDWNAGVDCVRKLEQPPRPVVEHPHRERKLHTGGPHAARDPPGRVGNEDGSRAIGNAPLPHTRSTRWSPPLSPITRSRGPCGTTL
jgi:hypothetical protein